MTRIGLPDSVRLILRPVEHCRMNIKRMSIKRVNIDRETHREHWTRVGANRARDLPNGASIKRWRRESLKKLDRWESQVLKNLKIAECCELMQRESDGWETVCSDCEEWNLRTGDPMENERCSGGDGKRGGTKTGPEIEWTSECSHWFGSVSGILLAAANSIYRRFECLDCLVLSWWPTEEQRI